MVLNIRLSSLEGQEIDMVELWVTLIYHGVTLNYDKVVMKRTSDWAVFHMEMLVPSVIIDFG